MLDLAERTVNLARELGADYSDARIERIHSTNIRFVKDNFEYVISGTDQGFGIRTLYDGAWGFAATSSLQQAHVKKALRNALKTAKATSVRIRDKAQLSPVKSCTDTVVTPTKTPLLDVGIEEKMGIVTKMADTVKAFSPKIASVTTVYGEASGERVIVTSEGTKITMKPSLATVAVLAVAKELEKITSCAQRVGAPGGFDVFEKLNVEKTAVETAKRAVNQLKAKPAPAGRFTVVVDPELGGVFAHEAVGHACEGDHVASGESILQGKIGRKVGSEHVTIFDDSTHPNGWGSLKYDMEGVAAQKKLLIEKGVLRNFITSREVAAKLGLPTNGGARAQSYAFRPIVRMSNTYIAPGDHTFEEMLEDIDYGVYVKATRGGQVDPAKGTFQFSAEEAFLIEKGKVTTPLLNVSLSGLTLEALNNIDAVAKDFDMHVGYCGKEEQNVPTGDGSPHIRIRNAVVGGEA